jgi:hypothetical protein
VARRHRATLQALAPRIDKPFTDYVILIADNANLRIRKISVATGIITTIEGNEQVEVKVSLEVQIIEATTVSLSSD